MAEENFDETGRRLDFEIDHEDDLELEFRRPFRKKGRGGEEGHELFGPPESELEKEIDDDDAGSSSCDSGFGSAVAGKSRHEAEYAKKDAAEASPKTKPKNKTDKDGPQKKEGDGTGELTEEERERRAILIQRIRQIMASRGGGRVRGDDLRRILGGGGVSFDEALREVIKNYGRALSDDEEGNKGNAEKGGKGLFPTFEAYAGGGSGGKSPYAMREKEQHSDVYAQTGAADVSPDKALKKMRGPYAEDTKCDSCKKGPYK